MQTREEKYPWFFKNSWDNIDSLLIRMNLSNRMIQALKDVHDGWSYGKAASFHLITKQNISQWFSRVDQNLTSGRYHINEIHRENL